MTANNEKKTMNLLFLSKSRLDADTVDDLSYSLRNPPEFLWMKVFYGYSFNRIILSSSVISRNIKNISVPFKGYCSPASRLWYLKLRQVNFDHQGPREI